MSGVTAMRQGNGFTLVEMVVVLAVIAIVMSYALPAYSRFVAQNKVQSFAYALLADLNNARSEAIRRGAVVEVCAASASTSTSCNAASASNWSKNWIMIADEGGASAVLKVHQAEAGAVASASIASFRFAPSGRVSAAGDITFRDSGATTSATVTVANYGSIRARGGMAP